MKRRNNLVGMMIVLLAVIALPAVGQNIISYDMGNETFLHRPSGGAFYPEWNHAGNTLAYVGNVDTIWTVDPTNVATATQVVDNTNGVMWGPLGWSPNDDYILFSSSAGTRPAIAKVEIATGTVTQNVLKASDLGLSDANIGVQNASITIGSDGSYWMAFVTVDYSGVIMNEGVYRIQIEADGTPIIATLQKLVDGFALFVNPQLSPDGDNLLLERPLTVTERSLYLVRNLSGGTLPVSGFSPSRTKQFTNGSFYATSPQFSQDGTLVFFCEDVNHAYNESNPGGTIPSSNFEVILMKTSDILANSFSPVYILLSGNQALVSASEGGTRLAYIDTQAGNDGLNISTLMIEAIITLGDSGELLVALDLTDGAGTQLMIDAGTQIASSKAAKAAAEAIARGEKAKVAKGGLATITMETPITPIEEIQQPPSGQLVRRDFGEDGLTFDPPGVLAVKYTDAEIEGLDESTLSVVTVDELGNTEEATVLSRDLDNNMLTVQVVHFSEYVVAPPGSIAGDSDGDGLTDAEEALLGTNPNDADSDNDGLSDYDEVWYDGDGGYNPYNPDTNPTGTDLDANDGDTDNDGMNDGQEDTFGSDPLDGGDIASVPVASTFTLLLAAIAIAGAGIFVIRRQKVLT